MVSSIVTGEALVSLALTEPRGGSDAANLRLRRGATARLRHQWREDLDLPADQADAAVVFGRTGSVEAGAHGVTALLVPMDAPGVTRNRFDCHGQRRSAAARCSSRTCGARQHRLAGEGKGFVQVMQGFDFSRALIGLQCSAAAQASLEETWEYVPQREAFGKPLAPFRASRIRSPTSRRSSRRAPALLPHAVADKGAPHTAEAAMCKWWAPKLAYDVIHQCLLMFGHSAATTAARAAPARRAGLPDRRRHRADHEAGHRAREGRPVAVQYAK